MKETRSEAHYIDTKIIGLTRYFRGHDKRGTYSKKNPLFLHHFTHLAACIVQLVLGMTVFRRQLLANIYTGSALMERSFILQNTRNIAFT
jgi:hypothetical protein